MNTRTVVVPDLGEELTGALVHAEELLLTFAAWEQEDAETSLPVPLADDVALAAVRRLWVALAPTQGERAVKAGLTGRQLGPDGRYEHIPLRVVDVAGADVATLNATARTLGDPHADDVVREALTETAQTYDYREAAELVATIARLAGVLDLAETAETAMLRERLAAVGVAEDVVFTGAEEDAYQATVDRVNVMWTQGNPLDRFAY